MLKFHFAFQETNNVTSAMLFLPMAKTTKILPYYYDIQPIVEHKNDLIAIVAIDMGLKSALFDELLFYDSWLIGMGAMCIFYCILIYTNSILITLSTVVANVLSIGVAYFIYQVVLQLPYFPFMNLLAIIIIVGKWSFSRNFFVINFDKSSNYYHFSNRNWCWRLLCLCKRMAFIGRRMGWTIETFTQTKVKKVNFFGFEHDGTCRKINICDFFNNGTCIFSFIFEPNHSYSMLWVTFLFRSKGEIPFWQVPFRSYVHRLYAAIVIAVNYVLMMTWLPSMVIIVEKMNMKLCKCWQSYVDAINVIIKRFGGSMEKAIIHLVDRLKYAFLILFCKFNRIDSFWIENLMLTFYFQFCWDWLVGLSFCTIQNLDYQIHRHFNCWRVNTHLNFMIPNIKIYSDSSDRLR